MVNKEMLKQIIVTFQNSIPRKAKDREMILPVNTEKIITVSGVRRSGKSTLFLLTINTLIKNGVEKSQILYLNFDDERLLFEDTDTEKILEAYRELYPDVDLSEVYMFFDEVQELPNWDKFIRRIYEQETKHIFVTGSNSKLLSSEIATSLRGRTLQYETFPLSFSEYKRFKNIDDNIYNSGSRAKIVNAFKDFLKDGGFPEIALCEPNLKLPILQEYYFTMIYRDMCERFQIKNPEGVKYFNRRILSNAAKPTSINKIVNEIRSQNSKFSKDTAYEYASQTESIYFFLPLTKFDTSYMREMRSEKKYYCIDTGFYSAILPSTEMNYGILLENAVYLWLRRGLTPTRNIHYLGNGSNCDFVIVENQKIIKAIQVSWDISDPKTYQREVKAFSHIDCPEYYLITAEEEKDVVEYGKTIHIVPAFKYLCN